MIDERDLHMAGTASPHREGALGNKKKSGVAAAPEPVEPPVQVQLSAQVLLLCISACLTCQAVNMHKMPGCNYARQDLMAACVSAGTKFVQMVTCHEVICTVASAALVVVIVHVVQQLGSLCMSSMT